MSDLDAASDPETIARDMIEVHGAAASALARDNARNAALSGRAEQARLWLRLVEIIQRRQAAGPVALGRTA